MNDIEKARLAQRLRGNGYIIRVPIYGLAHMDWEDENPEIDLGIAELNFWDRSVKLTLGQLSFEDVCRIQHTIELYSNAL